MALNQSSKEVSTFLAADEAADAEHIARRQLGVSLQDVVRTLVRKWRRGEIVVTPDDVERYQGRRARES